MISAEWIECFRHEEFLILVMQMMSCAMAVSAVTTGLMIGMVKICFMKDKCFVRLKKDQGWSLDKGKACHNRRLSGTPHGCVAIY